MRILSSDVKSHVGQNIHIEGWLHKKRLLGGLTIINVRDRRGLVQVVDEPRAPGGAELHDAKLTVLVPVEAEPPIEIDKPLSHKPDNLDTLFEYRAIGLRNLEETAIFKIQSAITRAIRDYFYSQEFTEIRTPKLLAAATEGGAEVFKIDYFGQESTLAQSPQFYKQIMVGVFERVFEIAPVYRAEPSATTRHMTEYISVDGEMGFITIDGLEELLSDLMNYVSDYIWKHHEAELKSLRATKPVLPMQIPLITMAEIHERYSKANGQNTVGEKDLRPDEERWICEYAAKELGSEAVFVSDWPAADMKFYHKAQEGKPELADRVDLLFRGVEIATGSMRENDYAVVLQQLKDKTDGDPEDPGFKPLLTAMQSGMPVHGGFGMGLERLTEKFLGLNNIKEATLFPRDINRLAP